MRKSLEDIPNNTVEAQQVIAERRSRQLGLPVIILARPGTYGSSGDHGQRRQIREFLALNAALDEIKKKYEIERFVLSGHSGGATAVGALLTLGREDIACAIMTSGAFGLLERAQRRRERRGDPPAPDTDGTGLRNPYDPLDHVAGVVKDPERKILIIGNRKDVNTPFDLQIQFKKALSNLGHQVRLMDYSAKEPDYHNLVDGIGYSAIQYCALSKEHASPSGEKR
nr:prolyl oligopeptidase family serine peptidase [Gammaproteobacteria bacterium]